jgi:hypothetical protein
MILVLAPDGRLASVITNLIKDLGQEYIQKKLTSKWHRLTWWEKFNCKEMRYHCFPTVYKFKQLGAF